MNCVEQYIAFIERSRDVLYASSYAQGNVLPTDEQWQERFVEFGLVLAELRVLANATTKQQLTPFLIHENLQTRKLTQLRAQELDINTND